MNNQYNSSKVKAVEWKDNALVLLDQRKLPGLETYISCRSVEDAINSIRNMVVRGAPAIGICAAYAAVLSAQVNKPVCDESFSRIDDDLDRLARARPTAVNLMWAVTEMRKALIHERLHGYDSSRFLAVALKIHSADIENNILMGKMAAEIFQRHSPDAVSVMTHCNAGSLATGGYGTALGAIRAGWHSGLIRDVYADETRPWLQGSRLTVWELMQDNIPVTLNVDGAAAWLIKDRDIAWIIVGADRIAANGDVANKIGTYSLAILAKYHGARVMVVAPSSTVDMNTKSGDEIEIEMRSMDELRRYGSEQISTEDVQALNPVFDVTPASLIDYIVTEKGVIESPSSDKMLSLFAGQN